MKTLALFVAAAMSACSFARPYPEVLPEICSDGVDQDLDGLVDCDDPDCQGECVELGNAFCTDGLDQDGDGLPDHQDPDCWPHAAVEVERCLSIRGFDGPLPVADDGAWIGDGRHIEWDDPEEGTVRVMLAQYGQYLVSGDVRTGAVEGMTIEVEARLQPAGRLGFAVLLASDPLRLPPTPSHHVEGLFVEFGLTDEFDGTYVQAPWVSVRRGPEDPAYATLTNFEPDRWFTIQLSIREGAVDVRLDSNEPLVFEREDTPVVARPPASWSVAEALRFGWSSSDAPEALVRSVRWARPWFHPCGHIVPQLDGPTIGAAVSPDGRLCVLTWSRPELKTSASVSLDGRTFARTGGFVTPRRDASDGALVWSDDDAAFVGAVKLVDDSGAVRDVVVVRSADCSSWAVEPAGLDPELVDLLAPLGVAYRIDPRAGHTIDLRLYTGVLHAHSPDGSGGSFVMVPGWRRLPVADGRRRLETANITDFEGHRIALVSDGAGLRLWLAERDGRWRPEFEPLLQPNSQTGVFDRGGMDSGRLVLQRPSAPKDALSGWVVHHGDRAGDTQTVVERVRWSP